MFQRLLSLIRDEFGLTRSQARGFLAMAVVMILCWFGPLTYDRLTSEESTVIPEADSRKADSLLAILEKIQPEKPDYSQSNRADYSQKDREENPEQPLSLFYFDPNTASAAQFQELGLPKFIAERIVKYRSKGGQFRQKEDLQKIYGLAPTLYERLEPYISIPEKKAFAAASNPPAAAAPSFTPSAPKPAFTKPALVPFDINSADTSQLIRLKGIGSKLAARIIKFRDGLGGFASTAQYAEVFGLDSLALSELHRFAQVRSGVQKISINTASPEELDRLPYLSKRQSEIIVRYREQHGAYKTPQDLLNIKILDEKLVNKIAPYLAF
ncbi:ComEA family DNA-binding protein [Runella slithyformis]|uniref:DNA uptake protein and related DNA-binding protein-like protein n=1 Tax=Runella slithyformis (strain ATCC 29530 / DSM 19594 / LMG 11500 / NCIMB 11436 / LSU 4) TaxID=761193 RepID=A0A7U3ZLT5_RUNSL|nr:helix-hairpin-helix domain-containing protein [Runella slithyformis]AEI49570.1 DNA uptake protein and related DNA-binding protein-like protein [Runella slithyformis DSM 19594]